MTPELTTLLTALATDVDDIRIVFEESSLTTLKIVIGAILFGIAPHDPLTRVPRRTSATKISGILSALNRFPCGCR